MQIILTKYSVYYLWQKLEVIGGFWLYKLLMKEIHSFYRLIIYFACARPFICLFWSYLPGLPGLFFSFQTKMNRDEPGFIPTLQGSISSSKVIHTHFFFLSFYYGILGEKLKFKIVCSCITAVANTFWSG